MPADPANARKMLYTTDYPSDMIVFKLEESRSMPTAPNLFATEVFAFPHGLPFRPLCIGSFSEDNFATSYDFGQAPIAFIPTFMLHMPRISAQVLSDSTNIYIQAQNFDTARTFYFRVICLPPTDAPVGSLPPPVSFGNEFFFNTDFNYMKIFEAGTVILPSSVGGTVDITHNLGYVPTILFFSEFSDTIGGGTVSGTLTHVGGSELMYANGPLTQTSFSTTAATLTNVDGAVGITMHYRIYIDE